jgi:hypothetical protein
VIFFIRISEILNGHFSSMGSEREKKIILESDGVWGSHMRLGVNVNMGNFRESHTQTHV